jgi:signal transduction histidine kinase
MRGIGSSRPDKLEVAWGAFAVCNLVAMSIWEGWETIPFHFIWISLTLLYGFRVWRASVTFSVLGAVVILTGVLLLSDAFSGSQLWGELFEVPLMSAMFLAMVWHARRRQDAISAVELQAEERASLLERQERFLHDASHELRTPVTIARGHLEVLGRTNGSSHSEVRVALDELERIERIPDRLLLLAKADQPDFLLVEDVDAEAFLEDVFMRWSEVAPRSWRLGSLARGTIPADPEALRTMLDALVENAVKYSDEGDRIELRSSSAGETLVIEVEDGGCGISPDALSKIFDRFTRADAARTRAHGGVGLGLAIVDAIAKAHGGRCSVHASPSGSRFTLRLPRFRPESPLVPERPAAVGAPATPVS